MHPTGFRHYLRDEPRYGISGTGREDSFLTTMDDYEGTFIGLNE